jgi:hypothetical protein
MANQRQYESATVFNARIVDLRHLWTPSTEFRGQATQKPNYFSLFIVPKTQAHWSQEPVFASVMQAFGKLLQGTLQWAAQNPNAITWPIVDGDMPSPEGKSSEFAKGHWLFSASTGNAPNVELVQAGGALVKLQNKVGVKAGDFVMTGITAAVKQNDPRGVKFYLNAVVFTAPGEEIVFANSVSGAELMRMAQQQGLQVAGFSGSPGFGGAPGGFGAPQGGGFAPPNGAPGFTPPPGPAGYAPTGVPAMTGAPGQFGAPAGGFGSPPQMAPAAASPYPQAPTNGNATFHSNPPQGQPFPGAAPAPGAWPQR